MAFDVEQTGFGDKKVEVLYPLNEIDSYNGEELKNRINEVIDSVDAIILNLSRVTYLNSSGLRELIQILKVMKDHKKTFFLTAVNDEIMKIFKSTNLNRLFNIYETNEDAVRYLT